MANVITIFGILISFGVSYPALLTFVWLMWPDDVNRSRDCLQASIARCFWAGLTIVGICATGIAALFVSASGIAQLLGWVVLILLLALSCRGASALVLHLAQRTTTQPSASYFLRHALLIELAAAFPVIGWVTILPFALCSGVGATWLALRRNRHRATVTAPILPTP